MEVKETKERVVNIKATFKDTEIKGETNMQVSLDIKNVSPEELAELIISVVERLEPELQVRFGMALASHSVL